MLSFKNAFYTISSEQVRKSEALSLTTSSLQLFQPSLLRMEIRLIMQADYARQNALIEEHEIIIRSTKKNSNIPMIDMTTLKGGAQNNKGMCQKKQTTQAIIQQKNEQLISANVPEDQMKRVYQNAYDDLSDMVAAIYFNYYLENTDLVEKKATDQESLQMFRNKIWNKYGQAVAKLIVKQNGIVYLIFNNEERYQNFTQFSELSFKRVRIFIQARNQLEYFDIYNYPVYFIINEYSNMKEVMEIMRQYGKSRREIQHTYPSTTMLAGSSVVYLDLKDLDEAKMIQEVIDLNGNKVRILLPSKFYLLPKQIERVHRPAMQKGRSSKKEKITWKRIRDA